MSAWDAAVAIEFAEEVQRVIRQECADSETSDPYSIAEELGKALLNLIDTTYGFDLDAEDDDEDDD